ncbi:hypothetical protein [Ornithinibacillus sp. JPR2-1]|uniref:hypothetical protein n=1 Tax=Ornithinibacillus sp. JPR2-1 TaxID=2094019 RepID=UPI0031E35D2A
MALKNKMMTATEARNLGKLHKQLADTLEYGKSKAELQIVVDAIGLALISKFIGATTGGLATVVTALWRINSSQNKRATASHLRGAQYAFERIASVISAGGHQRAEVQQVWIVYPSITTRHELVEGVRSNPGQAYKILRVQLKNGSWVSYSS